MIVESGLLLGGAYYLYRKSNRESIAKKKRIANIKNKWSILMDGIGNKAENKIEQKYEMLDIIEKHYGFDSIISIPIGKSLKDLRQLIPQIEVLYKSNTICEYSKNKNSAYMRVWFNGNDISQSDLIKFKWYSCFQGNNDRNTSGETYKLSNSTKISNPNNEKKIVGYRYNITIPNGLDYEYLSNKSSELSKVFGLCDIRYDSENKQAYCEIIFEKLDDKEKFTPIKCKPYELYVGMTNSYKPILFNFKLDPGGIWGGKSGTGKTVSYLSALINLATQYTDKDIQFYIAMVSDKQDLRLLKNTNLCKYYADNILKAYRMLLHLSNMCSERNRLFENQSKFVTNLYEYNELNPNNKLPIIYYCVDEIASFGKNGTELNEHETKLKEKCSALMWKLAREGRSAGIYSILSTQRGDVKNLDANIKGNLGNTLSFYFPNIASALTIIGVGDLASETTKLAKSREFICVADEVYRGKTLNLTVSDMEDYLKPHIVKDGSNLLDLDSNGKIVDKDQSKSNSDINNIQITNKKDDRAVEDTQKDKKRNSGRFKNLTQKKGK